MTGVARRLRGGRAEALARRIRNRLLPGHARSRTSAGRLDLEVYRSLDGPRLLDIPTFRVDPTAAPRLTVLMPHLAMSRMTGGPNTILALTGRLSRRGVPVRYVAAFGPLDADQGPLRAHIASLGGSAADDPSVELVAGADPKTPFRVGRGDVVMATWWPTAHLARAIVRETEVEEFLYLIQDFEPGFHPWSTRFALALATYGFPCRAIFNERLLLDHFAAQGVGRFAAGDDRLATSFEPAVDRSVFRPSPASESEGRGAVRRAGPRRLLFYARPRNERNLFDLGLAALRAATASGAFDREPWEFIALGADIPEIPLGPEQVLRSPGWLDYRAYARLLSESDLLLSLMLSPHTSYPPLEMAACGNIVVTNTFGVKTAEALRALSPRIRGAAPELESLVAEIIAAVRSIEAGEQPMAESTTPPDWDTALDETLTWAEAVIGELGRGLVS
jgi:O-antigen biosynthesis protein